MALLTSFPKLFLVLACLPLGLLTGVILFRADYCLAGMFRDAFLFRQTFMLRTLLLLVTISMVLCEVLRLLGLVSAYPFPGFAPPALTNVAGGLAFGTGMVLAGGCVFGTLYKMGRGAKGSWVAFAGLLAGSTLYAEIHPWWVHLGAMTRLCDVVTLSQLLGVAPLWLVGPATLLAAIVLVRWQRRGALSRPGLVRGDLQPRSAALLLALLGGCSLLLAGMPLGITTAYAKIGAYAGSALWPQHLAGLSYFQTQPLCFRPPLAATPLPCGAGPHFDALAAVQFPLVAGILLGSFLCARYYGELVRGGRLPARQVLSALLGGVLMGLGARLGDGCNVWHLLGGLPIFALQSLLFLAGLIPGSWLGSRLLVAWVLKS